MSNSQQTLPGGRLAAMVARGCIGKEKAECTLEFALEVLRKENAELQSGDLEKAKAIAERVLKEVVSKGNEAEALEAWASKVENLEEPFKDDVNGVKDSKPATATKAELQAAVKILGMGPSAYKGLSKDDPAAYCQELQRRLLAFASSATGEKYEELPSHEKLLEVKKAVEAKQELSSLDSSNIIQGRPKRRAASSAAEAIKRDIARDLEREAAQATSSEPLRKKAKNQQHEKDSADAAAGSSASSKKDGETEAESDDDEDDEEDEEQEEGSDSEASSGSGSSNEDDSSDAEEEEGEQSDE